MQNTKHRKIEKPRANDWRETIHDSQSMCCKHSHTTPPTTEEEKLMICTYGIPRREQVQAAHSSLPAMRNSLAQQTGNRATVQ